MYFLTADLLTQIKLTLSASATILIAISLAAILSLAIQAVWAWIDDSKAGPNWILKKLSIKNSCEWKYPVWNGKPEKGEEPFGYAKDPELNNNEEVWNLQHGIEYLYAHQVDHSGYTLLPIVALTLSPIVLFIAFKLYILTIIIGVTVGTAFLARYARRTAKKLTIHTDNKDIHKGVK